MSVLILTHPDDVHADAVATHLATAGVKVHRLDTAQLGSTAAPVVAQLRGGALTGQLADCPLEQVGCVWHRRPSQLPGRVHDVAELRAGVGGILAALPHLNHPVAMAAAHKPWQLLAAGRCGLHVPDTVVTSQRQAARAFALRHGDAVVVKAMSRQVAGLVATGDRTGWSRPIHLTQTRVRKTGDVRLTVVDRTMFATAIDSPHLDWRTNSAGCTYREVGVPPEVAGGVYRLMSTLNLRYGALDFAVDSAGRWWFLEVNPNGQWLWIEEATKQPISAAVAAALAS